MHGPKDGLLLLIFFLVNPILFIAIGYGAWKGKLSGFDQRKYAYMESAPSSSAPCSLFSRSGEMLTLELGLMRCRRAHSLAINHAMGPDPILGERLISRLEHD